MQLAQLLASREVAWRGSQVARARALTQAAFPHAAAALAERWPGIALGRVLMEATSSLARMSRAAVRARNLAVLNKDTETGARLIEAFIADEASEDLALLYTGRIFATEEVAAEATAAEAEAGAAA